MQATSQPVPAAATLPVQATVRQQPSTQPVSLTPEMLRQIGGGLSTPNQGW